ncbi:hypothetical protein F5Y05DRAFT_282212 [Hypoxylon sp. FL0543]|nr:hypothetical protein F5Y05DRAFT_282212 [Hypoxylon sp. FL0543]
MASNVFFQGSLQDGISLAIQQARMVLAFVTDGGDESQSWENELLTNDSLKSPLESYAVALRLPAGSEEAGYLEALFPIPKKPTIVIIQSGTLKEYIQGGTPKEDLIRRIAAILNTAAAGQSQQATPTPAVNQPPPGPAHSRHDETDDLYDDYDEPATSSTAPAPPAAQAAQPSPAQTSQETRRLEAEKKAKEAKLKAEREAKAKERREVNEGNDGQHTPAERTYAEEIRQRKIHAAEERKRILKRIEDDKRERREREAQEKRARLLLSATNDEEGSSSQTPAIPLPRRQEGTTHGDHCNLQVRLFDGSTIRSRFKNDATLAREVRKWIDEERTDGDAPYTFRIVLSPLPNKAIEPTEEIESLLSLGLTPSATLVLVPAKYSSAYAQSNNVIWRSLAYILGVFGAGYGLLTGVLGGITGMIFGRRGAEPIPDGIPLRNLAAARTASRIRGFRNPEDERRDAQLYNGNSLNFEPRRDDDEDGGNN